MHSSEDICNAEKSSNTSAVPPRSTFDVDSPQNKPCMQEFLEPTCLSRWIPSHHLRLKSVRVRCQAHVPRHLKSFINHRRDKLQAFRRQEKHYSTQKSSFYCLPIFRTVYQSDKFSDVEILKKSKKKKIFQSAVRVDTFSIGSCTGHDVSLRINAWENLSKTKSPILFFSLAAGNLGVHGRGSFSFLPRPSRPARVVSGSF